MGWDEFDEFLDWEEDEEFFSQYDKLPTRKQLKKANKRQRKLERIEQREKYKLEQESKKNQQPDEELGPIAYLVTFIIFIAFCIYILCR